MVLISMQKALVMLIVDLMKATQGGVLLARKVEEEEYNLGNYISMRSLPCHEKPGTRSN